MEEAGINRVNLIVPVFNGYADLMRCLASLKTSLSHNRTQVSILLVDDASSDQRIAPLLSNFVGQVSVPVRVTCNATNLGFVKTVNGAFEETKDDVIILNTDTVVATDWIDRLVRAAKSMPQVASVTPFSNNATIVSFPEFCAENPLPSRNQIGQLDAAFARLHAGRVEPIPTGVGFCMFIAREALDTIGGFDAERFGRGYGEENDFCLRASAAGWMHLAACDVYVGHSGGASFGDEKRERVAHALAVLENLHPGYEGLIAGFCHRDPLRNARLAVWAYMLDRSEYPSVLAVSHNRGGGTDKFLRDWSHRVAVHANVVAARADHDGSILLGPVDAPSTHIRLSSSSASGFVKRYLPKLHISRVFVNHLIDHPPGISSLIENSGLPFDVMLHDYTYLKGSPTDPLGGGEPDHPWFGPVLAHLLKSADGVFSPSQRAADIYQSTLPGLEVVVAPHPEEVADWSVRLSSSRGTVLTVAVVGALSAEKGADLLEQTALLAKQRNLPVKFVLIGHAYRELDGCIDASGPYQDEQIKSLIQHFRPDLIWLPARWEETYSYTLSVALRSGLPVLAPQIGAFPERLDGRPFSYLYPFDESAEQVCQRLVKIQQELPANDVCEAWQPPADFDHAAYLQARLVDVPERTVVDEAASMALALELVAVDSGKNMADLAAAILKFRSRPGWRRIASHLPWFIKKPILKVTGLIS